MIPCNVFYTPYSKFNVFPYKLEKILMLVILVVYALSFSSFSAFGKILIEHEKITDFSLIVSKIKFVRNYKQGGYIRSKISIIQFKHTTKEFSTRSITYSPLSCTHTQAQVNTLTNI